jgi:hypothetical protein
MKIDMNRRNFITTTALALPLSTLMAGNIFANDTKTSNRRSTNSYFTHDELKSWCEKNGCHYLTDNELKDEKLIMAFTLSNSDIEVNESYMNMWLKDMRNDRGNTDYRFMITDVRPEVRNDKKYISVHYVYGRL